jgi:hypothetical protein
MFAQGILNDFAQGDSAQLSPFLCHLEQWILN